MSSESQCVVRPFTVFDFFFLRKLRNKRGVREVSGEREYITMWQHLKWFIKFCLNPHNEIWVAEVAGKKVGYLRLESNPRLRLHFVSIAVDPGYHRLGVGSAMIRAMDEWCQSQGIEHVRALIFPDNIVSKKFFHAMGFALLSANSQVELWERKYSL